MRIGRFEVLATLGRGVRGTVFRARHEETGREVALKQLNGSLVEGSPASQRFLREARLLSTIESISVARVYSFEIIDEQPVIEGELLAGGLDQKMRLGPVELSSMLAILRDVLDGLTALHAGGVIHGDIKPTNVLDDGSGHWKLTDGGLSIIEAQTNPTLLASSVLYIAPETVTKGARREFRSDLYSVGMLGYEALLGVDGFNAAFPELAPVAASPGRWLGWLENPSLEAKPLHTLRPEIPQPVSQFIARLISKDLELRYGSADAALTTLLPMLNAPKPAPAPPPLPSQRESIVGRQDVFKAQPVPEPLRETAPRLIVTRAGQVEHELVLTHQTLRIGRDPHNDLVLSDPGKAVSRVHAEIRWEDGRYTIVDLDSQNGLLVNGKRKPHVVLSSGGQVVLGSYTLLFKDLVGTVDPGATRIMPPIRPPEPDPKPSPAIGKTAPIPSVAPEELLRSRQRLKKTAVVAIGLLTTAVIVVWGVTRRKEPPVVPPAQVGQETDAGSPTTTPPNNAAGLTPVTPVAKPPLTNPNVDRPKDVPQPPTPPVTGGDPKKKPAPISVLTGPAPTTARRPNESEAEWHERDRGLASRYGRARAAMDGGAWADALTLLTDLQRDEPDYQDVATRLGLAQRRVAALAYDEGAKAELGGAFHEALRRYQQAQSLDPTANAVSDTIKKLRARMKDEGSKSFDLAEHYQAYGRWSEAAKAYEKAGLLLPEEDPLRKIARERLDQIRK